ncbi:MAG: hypothetical protein FJ240_05480 [Nitrospira sp.]|nr:hypothetical protein [Nitrospira sp.]
MKKTLIAGLVTLFALTLISSSAHAVVQGACVNCHTMHNSQGNAPMNWDSSATPNEALLRGSCIGCHGQAPSGANNIITNIPQVLHNAATDLAGGNFAYITTSSKRDAADSGATQNSVGHNVIDLGGAYQEIILTSPPGDENTTGITNTNFTCGGVRGCHGDRTQTGSYAAVRGAHHANDSVLKFGTISEAGQGGTTALSYRFLKGVKGGEVSNWQNTNATNHNEYKGATSRGAESTATTPGGGTISGLCAECHGDFHGTGSGDIGTASPWLRHPTDIVLPSDTAKEYYLYNGGAGSDNPYSVDAPVARATIPNAISGVVNPGTDDSIVMCLSCHGAHATKNADILRWNYSTINAGGGSNATRCFICHTTKDTGS